MIKILGIETSCDETAAAIVTGDGEILSSQVLSQIEEHRPYGGVVPEIAARAHLDHLDGLIRRAMDEAGLDFSGLDGIAATAGPGLIGGVMVGATMGKAIAAVHNLPFLAINHLEGHALTARLTDRIDFPYLLLLVSGGHSQLLAVEGADNYQRLGTTIDDAIGEAFDKTAKLLGLGYPGGPEVDRLAARCSDPAAAAEKFPLPRPMKGRPGCDFSFSGIKTAVRNRISDAGGTAALSEENKADICASFQLAVGDVLVDRCEHAIDAFLGNHPERPENPYWLVVAGGVAANTYLRRALGDLTNRVGMHFSCPPMSLCSDNAAMIAWAGVERLKLGKTDGLDFAPRPRWPLDPDAPPAIGAGVKA